MKKIILLLLLVIMPIISIAQTETSQDQVSNTDRVVSLYPNPATNTIYIDCKNYLANRIEVYNILGEKVLETGTSTNANLSVDISNLTSGKYMVKVIAGKESVIKILIKL